MQITDSYFMGPYLVTEYLKDGTQGFTVKNVSKTGDWSNKPTGEPIREDVLKLYRVDNAFFKSKEEYERIKATLSKNRRGIRI